MGMTIRSVLGLLLLSILLMASSCPCPDGKTQCGSGCNSMCEDLGSDAKNCGACGHACDAGQKCTGGTCGPACPPGQKLCGSVCIDTSSDPKHCGACGVACGLGFTCESGKCVSACTDPLAPWCWCRQTCMAKKKCDDYFNNNDCLH
jgi:hypothetical protein